MGLALLEMEELIVVKIPVPFTRELIALPKFSVYFLILEKLVTEHGKLGQPAQTLELLPVLRIFLKLSSR